VVHLWYNCGTIDYKKITIYMEINHTVRNMQKSIPVYTDRVFVSMRPAMRKDIQKVAEAYDVSESAAARNLIKIGLETSGYESE
jgi:hypothetical protein